MKKRRHPGRRRGAAAQRWPREEEGPRMGRGNDQGGGGALPLVTAPGRRRGALHPFAADRAAIFCGDLWEEERGRRWRTGPEGGGVGPVRVLWATPSGRRREGVAGSSPWEEEGGGNSNSLVGTPGGFACQTGDHRPADAEVLKITRGQGIQFADRLTIDSAASPVFLHALNRAQQAASKAGFGGGSICLGDDSHFRILSHLIFAPFPDGPVL